jgi:hypothetical protein
MKKAMPTALVLGLVFLKVGGVLAAEPDWSTYADLLQQYVQPGEIDGVHLQVVDYEAIQADPDWPKLTGQLEAFSPEMLEGNREKMAFYINAYNILAIKVVLDHWPLNGIKDAGSLFRSVWKIPAGRIGGRVVTLDEIEHGILRPMNDPRIHMAIVCASVSCPDLLGEPYTAARLDEQLDRQSIRFLENPGKGLDMRGDHVVVSRIFDWFSGDFEVSGGVAAFIKRYRRDLPIDRPIRAEMPYNWGLNGKAGHVHR